MHYRYRDEPVNTVQENRHSLLWISYSECAKLSAC